MEDLKIKVEKLKNEVEKAKKDIQDTYEKFRYHKFTNTHKIEHAFSDSDGKTKIKKDFLNFLKNNPGYLSKTDIKRLKNLELKTKFYRIEIKKEYYNKKVVDHFKEALNIFNRYGEAYEKQQLTEELCKYTDCLEKLTPTKTCKQCHSEYPKEAKFCPACGCELYKPIIDSSNLTDCSLSNIRYQDQDLELQYNGTASKAEKVQEKKEDTRINKCPYYEHCNCYCNIREYEKCTFYIEYKQKETKKENPQCPYATTKCRGYIESLCKDYKECVGYRTLKEEEETKKKCPHFDKCPNLQKSMAPNHICNDEKIINIQYRKEYCNEYQNFEKEKNRCTYYQQCLYYSKDSNVCIFIEDKEANMGCAQHYEFRKKEAREKGGLMFA